MYHQRRGGLDTDPNAGGTNPSPAANTGGPLATDAGGGVVTGAPLPSILISNSPLPSHIPFSSQSPPTQSSSLPPTSSSDSLNLSTSSAPSFTPPVASETSSNKSLIGGAAGAAVVLIFLVVGGILLWKRRRSSQPQFDMAPPEPFGKDSQNRARQPQDMIQYENSIAIDSFPRSSSLHQLHSSKRFQEIEATKVTAQTTPRVEDNTTVTPPPSSREREDQHESELSALRHQVADLQLALEEVTAGQLFQPPPPSYASDI